MEEMKLIFEKSHPGRKNVMVPELDVPMREIPDSLKRKDDARFPEVSETDISRHYTQLANRIHGVNDGFYPLGSCTMKYNPKINDEMAALPNFANIHPLQPENTVQGSLELLNTAEQVYAEITGMDYVSFQPGAGAHGEFLGLLLTKAYQEDRGEGHRDKIIVPDSAHGTNPASASMLGYTIVNIPSNDEGGIDIEVLRAAVGDDTAGFMLTNPNTVGKFERHIKEITQIIHDAGGVNYYDGANLNAVMGVVKPGEMGFDVVHLNLHKTFSTPHGGGGPGSGAVGCKEFLKPFLPNYHPTKEGDHYTFKTPEKSIGSVKAFYGNFAVDVRALTYPLVLGREGIPHAAKSAVLNANYMQEKLRDLYDIAYEGPCMHEFILALERVKKETGADAKDFSKAMLDNGMHPPTMYFPLIVPEALMVEPTETESKETLDNAIEVYRKIYNDAYKDVSLLKNAPLNTPVRRVDEVEAARHPIVKYGFNS